MPMPLFGIRKSLVDPVCGMGVTENTEWKIEYKGKIYYFCSEGCLNEFKKNPEKYI